MPIALRSLIFGVVLSVSAGMAQAHADYGLEINGLSVSKDGQIWVNYTVENASARRVCVPGHSGQPDVNVRQFRASDNSPLVGETGAQDGTTPFRSTYVMLKPGGKMRAKIGYSAQEYARLQPQTWQALRPAQVLRDALYVILALPVRGCPLFTFSTRIAFNRDQVRDQVVQSLPSRVFSLSKPGWY